MRAGKICQEKEVHMIQVKMAKAALALALAGGAMPVLAQTPPPPPPAEAKTSATPYVMAAGMSDLYEINSSQIALQKSKNADVRSFASMLIKHHNKTTAATMKAAKKAGLTPPPPELGGAAASIAELQNASEADFDRLYLAQQLPAHQAALDLHQSFAANGDKTPLRMSAKSAVPIVRQHIAAAERLMNKGSMAGHSGM
jgi:putative membrane protein